MKKRILAIIIIFIICLQGCTFKNEKQTINEETSTTNLLPVNINISDKVANPDQITSKLNSDLEPLVDSGLPLKKYSLNVEDKLLKNKMSRTTTALTCSADQIQSGEYLEELVVSCIDFNIKDTWKKYALFSYLYDEDIDENEVISFLNNEDNKDVLSMFEAYFSTYYVDTDELKLNTDVAKLYGRYIIEKYGVEELQNCEANEYINEWLSRIGITYLYTDEYAELLNQFSYSENDNYAMVVETDQNIKYFLAPPSVEGKDVFLLRQFLYESYNAVDNIMKKIKTDAPDYYNRANELLNANTVRAYFDLPIDTTEGYTEKSEIHLSNYYAFAHEICHILVPNSSNKEHVWRNEGFCCYAQFILNSMSSYKLHQKENQETYLEKGRENSNNKINYDTIHKYTEMFGLLENDEDFLPLEYLKLQAQIEIEYQNAGENVNTFYAAYASIGQNIPEEENSELTYVESLFFVDYLISNYSLNNFLGYCYDDLSFEEAFGIEFKEALNTWKQNVIESDQTFSVW